VLAHVDAGNLPPARKDPGNIEATLRTLKKFIKPSVDDVAAYCAERGNGIHAQAWVDNQESRGWKVGKNQTPMADWKATIRTWENNRRERQISAPKSETLLQPDFIFFRGES
jgi:hypothetical protein